MCKRVVFLIFCSIMGSCAGLIAQESGWEEIGRGNSGISCILIQDMPQAVYFGSNRGVFKGGRNLEGWETILSLRGSNKKVNLLSFDAQNKSIIYAATANGLFRAKPGGRRWERIFRGKGYMENECTALLVLREEIYLGTKAGVFISTDKGVIWRRAGGEIARAGVLAFCVDSKEPEYVYAACEAGVFKSVDKGLSWEKVFSASSSGSSQEQKEDTSDENPGESESGFVIRYIAASGNGSGCLYLATSRGAYKSRDRGRSWEALPDYGLLSRDIRFLLAHAGSGLLACADSGVFEYKDGRWYELSFRLMAHGIKRLAVDSAGIIYAAAESGLYRSVLSKERGYGQADLIKLYSNGEPAISEVQKAAVKYAEVEPEKILRWRRQAAKKALLPTVSAGVSRDVGDLWHWETGSTTKYGDDNLIKGKAGVEWDVRLAWNLGEVIWNNDQTSIDSRSRLTVQLRQEVLDEVNKIYFERMRLKAEIDSLPIEDKKKMYEKQLRLMELTASLDSLTGGYFASRLKRKEF